jgi:hypothetical protein
MDGNGVRKWMMMEVPTGMVCGFTLDLHHVPWNHPKIMIFPNMPNMTPFM